MGKQVKEQQLTAGQQAIIDAVPLVSKDDFEHYIPMSQYGLKKKTEDKPVVKYTNEATVFGEGSFAFIGGVICHPNPDIPDGSDVTTSRVLSYDEATGRVETMNTIYVKA